MPKIKAKKAVKKSVSGNNVTHKKKVVKKVAQKVTPPPQKAAVPQRALVLYEALAYEVATINYELSAKVDVVGGKSYIFTTARLSAVLKAFKDKENRETIATIMQCHKSSLDDMLKRSPTFHALARQASDHMRRLTLAAIEYKLQVVPAHWEEAIDKKTGEKTTQWVEAKEPTDFFVRWVAEHQVKDEFAPVALSEKDDRSSLTINDNRTFIGEKADAYSKLEQHVLSYGRKQQTAIPKGN